MAKVRASWLKLVVGTAKRRPTPEREAILGAMADEFRAEIRAVSHVSWVPAERFAELHHIVLDALGEIGARDFWRQLMLEALSKPMLKPIRAGALSMFGENPGSLLKYTPHAFNLVTRDLAKVSFSRASPTGEGFAGACMLSFSQFPSELGTEVFEPLCVGGAAAALDLLGYQGETFKVDASAPGRIDVVIQWRPGVETTQELPGPAQARGTAAERLEREA